MKYIIMIGILAIMLMEMMAILHGIDGKLLTMSVATVAGIIGWIVPSPIKKEG